MNTLKKTISSWRNRRFLFVLLTIIAIAPGPFVNKAHAQNQDKGVVYFVARAALISQGYSICEDRYYDLLQGESAYFYRMFYAGTAYKIMAITDDTDVKDVDLFVYNDDGSEYTKDADASSAAAVSFTPSINRYLKVVYKNYKSNTPDYRSTIRLLVGFK